MCLFQHRTASHKISYIFVIIVFVVSAIAIGLSYILSHAKATRHTSDEKYIAHIILVYLKISDNVLAEEPMCIREKRSALTYRTAQSRMPPTC